MEKTARF